MKRIFIAFTLSTIVSCCLMAQTGRLGSPDSVLRHHDLSFFFKFDETDIRPELNNNKRNLETIDSLLAIYCDRHADIDSVVISSYASPEGHPSYNARLSLKRSERIRRYLLSKCAVFPDQKIQSRSLGENWQGLHELVLTDLSTPYRSQVLQVLSLPIGSLVKEQRIRDIAQGASWSYIEKNMLRYLRGASCVMFFFNPLPAAVPADTVADLSIPVELTAVPVVPLAVCEEAPISQRIVRPAALKTNLLFDAATLLNVELEVPVAPRFSIAGEWIFPWWLWENKQNCIEVLSGNLEARYWFKPNYAKQDPSLGRHNPLSGWFVGLYGGGGLYDLERKREGYQGEFFIATGLSGGYVLPLKRNLSMEFSLGVGVLRTKYRHYHAEFCDIHERWHLTRQYSGQYTWIGPTRAKVSLVWYPHLKLKKKGGKL